MHSRWNRSRKPVSLPLQLYYLKETYPGSTGQISSTSMQWSCWIQPSPITNRYRFDLRYQLGKTPASYVMEPNLSALAPERELPHMYDQSTYKLCLYQPAYKEWLPHLLIARTIVPWAVMWFYYFELWLVTDVWSGNGEHPAVPALSRGG